MACLLTHLESGWAVDQSIVLDEERVVVIRFGHDWDQECMVMDHVLANTAEKLRNMAAIYVVDVTEVCSCYGGGFFFSSHFNIFLHPFFTF